MKPGESPIGCLNIKPNKNSIRFAGKYINLSTISRTQNLDLSYLSKIFRCIRNPNIRLAQRIAASLGMTLDDFVIALDKQREELEASGNKVLKNYHERIAAEDKADLATAKQGIIPAPRLPVTRAS